METAPLVGEAWWNQGQEVLSANPSCGMDVDGSIAHDPSSASLSVETTKWISPYTKVIVILIAVSNVHGS